MPEDVTKGTNTDTNGRFVVTITVPSNGPSPGFPTQVAASSRTDRGHASAPFTMG
jgi:hypothetical protein